MTTETEQFLGEVTDAQQNAELAFRRGDAEPRLAMWSPNEPVSWLGQFGTTVTGSAALTKHFHWVASRFSDLEELRYELIAADVIGDAAYTVGYEQWVGTFEGQPDSTMTHRVSRVYRREGGRWRIAHGHGDVAPPPGLAAHPDVSQRRRS